MHPCCWNDCVRWAESARHLREGTARHRDGGRSAASPGDFIGQGAQFTFTAANGTITAQRNFDNGVEIDFAGSQFWRLEFAPPEGVAFAPGVYEGATRFAFHSPSRPGLDVSGDGRGCNELSGRFVVLEVVFSGPNDVQRFAADYEQHCEGRPPALFGAVRFNSAIPITPRFSVGRASIDEGDSGTRMLRFNVSLSDPAGTTLRVGYGTVDGTATAGADYTAVAGTATFPPGETEVAVMVPIVGDLAEEPDETFILSLQNPSGAPIAFGQGLGTIRNDDPYKTLMYFKSEPGDYVGEGQEFTLTRSDGNINAHWNFENGITVSFDGEDLWDAEFAPPDGVPLRPGVYEGATRFSFQSPTHGGLDVGGAGRGCNKLIGRFVVLEAVYDGSGEVLRFAADYEQHCEGAAPALFGSIRFKSAVPAGPRLSVGPADIYEGDAGSVQLRFMISLSRPASTPVGVGYATANGTATDGPDYTGVAGTASFPPGETEFPVIVSVQGDLASEADETLTLSLQNPAGAPISFGQAVGTIRNDDPYKTLLYFNSQPGDFIGGGQRFTLTPIEGRIGALRTTFDGGVYIFFQGDDHWTLNLAPRTGGTLVPGVYLDAASSPDATHPRLDVGGAGRGCSPFGGRFVVLEAVYGPSGEVERFAADYEQHCEGRPPALFGSVRFNSAAAPGPRLYAAGARVTEGSTGVTNLAVPVWLSEPRPGPVSVGFSTSDGTATGGADYGSTIGTLTVPTGLVNAAVNVPVFGDTLAEADETLTVHFNNAVGATLGVDQAVGTILDDDPPPVVSVGDVSLLEGAPGAAGQATFTLSLNVASGQTVSVGYATQQGTALVGQDFVDTFGTLVFAAGVTSRTVTVPLLGDFAVESDETFNLILHTPGAVTIGDGTGQGTILDDDQSVGFFPVAPCRLLDTRVSGPAVGANTTRSLVAGGSCGVPATAKAVAVIVTAVGPTDLGDLRLYPGGTSAPLASVLNFRAGRTRAGNSIVSVGAGGQLTVRCDMPPASTGATHVVVDVFGYFE